MAYPRKIRNFTIYIDGLGYFGRCTSGTLPELKLKTEAHRAAGMDAPLAADMGMEAMTAEMVFAEWAPELIKHFGKRVRATFRAGAMGEDDFEADAFMFDVGGRVSVVSGDELKSGDGVMLKLSWEVDFYRIEREGEELVKIDVENGVRIIGGEDQLASMRVAMGL